MLSFLATLNCLLPCFALSNGLPVQSSTSERLEDEFRTLLYVQTPNGSNVLVTDYVGDPLEPSEVMDYIVTNDAISPYNVRIKNPTRDFNCHSFAWHAQSDNEIEYWMYHPSLYYQDGSYTQVSSFSSVVPGDKIVYFDSQGIVLHSGIVSEVLDGTPNGVCGNSNLVVIDSKWGEAGLYKSRGDRTPYTSNNNGTAAYVQFYHYNYSHTHAFTLEPTDNDDYHLVKCDCTGYYELHTFINIQLRDEERQDRYIPARQCTGCGYISYMVY